MLPLSAQKIDTLKYCVAKAVVGVGGFDPVSYFIADKPLQGNLAITTHYDGVEYRFATVENKSSFLEKPMKFLPQYGGWCSMTLAMGRATTPKYDNFLISNDKLFLFERTLSINGRELWLMDPKGNATLAEATYQKHITSGRSK